ncbi:hypothetical protein TrLO_g10735 [Triparma laevis f. longispina]|uniref:Holocytochrome c-type synthase n=1 Tax=Triparma laevis f. longispina TaxID=1714387 RepID=A0A9W6ZWI1_9STRA|nr:hypothetical protein TrLO_g10735 [Triparma laevis f. longispina]
MGATQSTPPTPPPSNAPSTSTPPNAPAVEDLTSKCPMKPGSVPLWAKSLCPVKDQKSPESTAESGEKKKEERKESLCPVKGGQTSTTFNVYSQPIDPKNNMPVHANNLPSPNQAQPLSEKREKSTIPKGNTLDTWTYPSPQMFWNSINRKNKVGDTTEKDVETVVAIHNNMNETTWKRVVEWEKVILGPSSEPPRLLKFIGRPMDLSPKARIKSWLSHPLPFDRHDWTVQREDGSVVRYVIDYYYDESKAADNEAAPLPSMHDESAVKSIMVDVRPAIDSPVLLAHRVVTMPLARMQKSTDFKPLKFMPSESMKAQVGESQRTWDSIIKNNVRSDTGGELATKMSKSEIDKVAKQMRSIKVDCVKVQKRVDDCTDEMDCARASLGLTMCMAKIACPLQHAAVVKVLEKDEDEEGKVEKALENAVACVAMFDEKVAKGGVNR